MQSGGLLPLSIVCKSMPTNIQLVWGADSGWLQTGLTTDIYIISGVLFFLAGCFYSMAFLNVALLPGKHSQPLALITLHALL